MKELSDIDIRHFKLSSGEDVVSMVAKEEDNVIIVTQPMQMHTTINNSTQAYYFTDWQPMAKLNACAISKLHIVTFAECTDNMKEKYIRMCLDTSADTDMGMFLDTSDDIDELDVELDEYLDPDTDENPTIH